MENSSMLDASLSNGARPFGQHTALCILLDSKPLQSVSFSWGVNYSSFDCHGFDANGIAVCTQTANSACVGQQLKKQSESPNTHTRNLGRPRVLLLAAPAADSQSRGWPGTRASWQQRTNPNPDWTTLEASCARSVSDRLKWSKLELRETSQKQGHDEDMFRQDAWCSPNSREGVVDCIAPGKSTV
eukprot:3948236-Amphidinium_carterae.1